MVTQTLILWLVATSLSNLIIWTVVIGPGVEILLPLIRAMLSVMCSRLMLNIRVTITRHAPTTGQGNEEIDLSDECDRALDIQLERFEAQARGEDMSKKRAKGLRRMWANKRPSGDVHPGFAMVPEDMSVPPSPLSPLSPTPGIGMSDRAISIIPLLSQYSHRSRQLSGNLAEIALQQESSGSSPTTSAYPPSETNSHYKPQPFETMQDSSRSTSLSRRILPLHKQSRDLTTPVSASAHTSSSPSRSRRPASAGNQGYRGYGDVHVPMVNLSRSQTLPAQSRPRYVDEEAGESDTVLDETNDAEEEIEVEVEFDRPGYEGGARTSGESSTEEERDRRLREWQEEWEWNWRDKWRPSFSASRRPSR
ncbi:hypothetical protein FRC03_010123 [Tulasnella sp. 419]|nr:hypothetical protein FRC03_010123 [Tulasnella sp. 419]